MPDAGERKENDVKCVLSGVVDGFVIPHVVDGSNVDPSVPGRPV